MTLSFATLPFSSTFSMPKNFCRALISAGSAAAAANVDRAHRTLGKTADRNRMHFMGRPPLRSASQMQAPVPAAWSTATVIWFSSCLFLQCSAGLQNSRYLMLLKSLWDCCSAPDGAERGRIIEFVKTSASAPPPPPLQFFLRDHDRSFRC